MGDGWFPGAIRDPGRNVNYRRGRTSNQMDVAHFTVGTDSRALIRDQGLAAFLFPKSGPPFQFCQADSVTAHACEFNAKGCGYEVERLSWDEPLTADQIHWIGEVLRWRNAEYGVPLVHYSGPRLPTNTDFRGIANHGSLQHHACDQHSDGWTDAEFAAAVGGSTPTGEDEMRGILRQSPTNGKVWFITGNTKSYVSSPEVLGVIQFLAKDWCVGGDGSVKPAADSYLNALVDIDSRGLLVRLGQFIARLFPKKAERAGGAPGA